MILEGVAVTALCAAAACLYAATPRQQWLKRALPARWSLAGGGMLSALGTAIWAGALAPVAALFAAMVVLMCALTLLPALTALRLDARKDKG